MFYQDDAFLQKLFYHLPVLVLQYVAQGSRRRFRVTAALLFCRSRALNSKAVDLMNQWYQEHIEHPYPSDDQKKIMADKGGITVTQVRST